MAENRDFKGKRPAEIDYGSSPKDAFKKGSRETKAHYRKKLAIYKAQTSAIVAKHEEAVEVNRIGAKLELLDHLNEASSLMSEKVKLQADLRVAKRKMSNLKVPNIDWFKLGQPDMF
ncbi:Uncharacterized protein Rs2_15728 [Raphanus sativus]|nr:Uncharacterized protein Rs2_15728 [Raphanus sativus]